MPVALRRHQILGPAQKPGGAGAFAVKAETAFKKRRHPVLAHRLRRQRPARQYPGRRQKTPDPVPAGNSRSQIVRRARQGGRHPFEHPAPGARIAHVPHNPFHRQTVFAFRRRPVVQYRRPDHLGQNRALQTARQHPRCRPRIACETRQIAQARHRPRHTRSTAARRLLIHLAPERLARPEACIKPVINYARRAGRAPQYPPHHLAHARRRTGHRHGQIEQMQVQTRRGQKVHTVMRPAHFAVDGARKAKRQSGSSASGA